MWRFVLDRGKEGAGIAVNTVNTELIRFGTPGTGWFVRLGLVSFNRIESVGMVVEPDSITQAEFISSGRYLAKLCNDVTNIIIAVPQPPLVVLDSYKRSGKPPVALLRSLSKGEDAMDSISLWAEVFFL